MSDRSILYTIRAALQGGFTAVASEIQANGIFVGILSGVNNVLTALVRFDGTGIGAPITRFTGAYTADNTNIDKWGGNQLNRLRCTDSGTGPSVSGPVPFNLPTTADLNTAFDALVAKGQPEIITMVIEYTGPTDDYLSIRPSASPSPQITGASSITVRTGVAAELEITRESAVISDFVWLSIGGIPTSDSLSADAFKFINPATAVWNASSNGTLPTVGVVKGNAYQVANAPSDGSGRFGEVMQNGDWVVWTGETFTSWSASPHLWVVLAAHDVRRITALEDNFLANVNITPTSHRNGVIRGQNYADISNEIRMKIYELPEVYSAADLNNNGDVDEYTDAADKDGPLAIRFGSTQANLGDTINTLYVFNENANGEFTRLLTLSEDFTFQGDFGAESDWLSNEDVHYSANDTWRVYVGTVVPRYSANNFDIFEDNLSDELRLKVNRTDPAGNVDELRLAALESKVAALYPLTPDVQKLIDWADLIRLKTNVETVDITHGYSLIADFRGPAASDRYESAGVTYDDTGTNVITYTGLSEDLHRAFGFKVNGPANQVLMWLVDGSTRIPYIDMTSGGNLRVNNYTTETTQGVPVQNETHFLTKTSGDDIVDTSGNISTFTITAFPASATAKSRSLQVGLDVYLNGSNTQAEGLVNIALPAENTAQDRQTIVHDVYLGPLYSNRTVRIELGYTLRVSGSDLLVDFTLVGAPGDISVAPSDVVTLLNYTPASTTTRTDNFVSFDDAGGTYVFAGGQEFLISFQPHHFDNAQAVVAVGRDASTGTVTQLNDLLSPQPSHGFDSVEVPDQVALANFEFRTFLPDHFLVHSDLANLVPNASDKWCYGLALLREVMELAISGQVRFDSDGIIIPSPDQTEWGLGVTDLGATDWTSI